MGHIQSATADDVSEWQTAKIYQECGGIMKSLPDNSRTCRFSAVHTFEVTQVFPTYMRIYGEDLKAIDQALDDAPQQLSDFHCFLFCVLPMVSARNCEKMSSSAQVLSGWEMSSTSYQH